MNLKIVTLALIKRIQQEKFHTICIFLSYSKNFLVADIFFSKKIACEVILIVCNLFFTFSRIITSSNRDEIDTMVTAHHSQTFSNEMKKDKRICFSQILSEFSICVHQWSF